MAVVLLLLPIGLLLLGFPIFLILLVVSTVLILGFVDVPLTQLHVTMFGSVEKFVLLAVPFFIFAGELMGRGGMSKRIVDWVLALIGPMRGSLALTAVGTCTIFGAISGSSPATVAAVGQLLHQPMRRAGYPDSFTVPLITSSGSIALIVPPSIAMILYGMAAEQSVSLLFIAGIVPGILIAVMIAAYIYVFAVRKGIREVDEFRFDVLVKASKDGVWALGMPVIVLGGIYAGIVSPTEAAGIACVYAILVTRFIYREISWPQVLEVAVSSMRLTAQILIIVAAAGVFSWLLTVTGVTAQSTQFIEGLNVSPWIVLLAINVLLLVVGAFLDPNSAILVLTPLLIPIVQPLGLDLVHFGVIMTVNMSIGMFTPPFGLNIFVSQALFRTPLSILYPRLVPFIAVNILALALVTYIPEISLFLTRFAQ